MLRSHPGHPSRTANLFLVTALILLATGVVAQEKTAWSDQEKPIAEQLRGLRKLDDTTRARTTKALALQIRQLPASQKEALDPR